MSELKTLTYFKIEFEDWSNDFDYTIVPRIEDTIQYLQMAEGDLDDGERKTKVIITGVEMTERQYDNWIKRTQPS